jgi:hypothetical protein
MRNTPRHDEIQPPSRRLRTLACLLLAAIPLLGVSFVEASPLLTGSWALQSRSTPPLAQAHRAHPRHKASPKPRTAVGLQPGAVPAKPYQAAAEPAPVGQPEVADSFPAPAADTPATVTPPVGPVSPPPVTRTPATSPAPEEPPAPETSPAPVLEEPQAPAPEETPAPAPAPEEPQAPSPAAEEPPAPAPVPAPAPPGPAPEETPVPAPAPAPAPVPEEPPTPAPPAEEPPAPAQPTAEPIFEGAELDNFALLQAAPAAITEVPDPLGSGETVLKMTVDDGDVAPITPTDNPRAQALSPTLIESGDEIWLATKFMLPEDFPTVTGWMSLVSIYGPPFRGPSPVQVGVEGGKFSWMRNGTYRYDVPWQMPLQTGRWVKLLLHERFATDGWVEMWIDGQQVTFFSSASYNPSGHAATERLEMETMDSSNNGGANAAKIMQYREAGMFETASVYFGPLLLGDSRESVEG